MQQIVSSLKRVDYAEGIFEYRHNVHTPKWTIGLGQHIEKARLLFTRKFGWLPRLLFDRQARNFDLSRTFVDPLPRCMAMLLAVRF